LSKPVVAFGVLLLPQAGLLDLELTNGDGGNVAAERLVLTVFPALRGAFEALRDFGRYLS
jgi:hypothetical protein